MNNTGLKENWTEQKKRLKQKFATLTESDLLFENAKQEEVMKKLHVILNKTKEELQAIIAAI